MKRTLLTIALVLAVMFLYLFYQFVLVKTVNIKSKEFKVGINTTNLQFDNLVKDKLGLTFPGGISRIAGLVGYKLTPCKIIIPQKTNLLNFLKILRKNRNQTNNLILTAGMYKKQVIQRISNSTIIDTLEIERALNDTIFLNQFNCNPFSWPILFTPNTYNVSYKINIRDLFTKMHSEMLAFWNKNNRLELAKSLNLTPLDVSTIASIVEKESSKFSEYGKIASVYKNRLKMGMRLQADPTIVFLKGVAERVKGSSDLNIKSPYNTYLNLGVPPGPICLPSSQAIDSVLTNHIYDYLYFCAKSDFSGCHLFEKSYEKHKKNAKLFHNALNVQEKIRAKKKGTNPLSLK